MWTPVCYATPQVRSKSRVESKQQSRKALIGKKDSRKMTIEVL